MNKLMIADLCVTEELDGRAMTAVSGGTLGDYWLVYPSVVETTKFSAQQASGQLNDITNNTGNNVAFAYGITSTVTPSQSAQNTINFGH